MQSQAIVSPMQFRSHMKLANLESEVAFRQQEAGA
jgi:hypothetical protein